MKTSCFLSLCIFLPSSLLAAPLKIIGWNTESGGARLSGLTPRVSEIDDCDIWGFSEVRNQDWLTAFERAAETGETTNYAGVLGTTGGPDRLAILFNEDRLRLNSSRELNWINTQGRVRAPLVAHFTDKKSGTDFLFVVNHLYRSRGGARHQQSSQLNEWAAEQELGIIAVGDYNYDWEVDGGDIDHDEGYDFLTAGNIFRWVRPPEPLVRTQGNVNYNSVLDFVFVGGAAKEWESSSSIIVREADFPDSNRTSDHRPVQAIFEIPIAAIPENVLGTEINRPNLIIPDNRFKRADFLNNGLNSDKKIEELNLRIKRIEDLLRQLLEEKKKSE